MSRRSFAFLILFAFSTILCACDCDPAQSGGGGEPAPADDTTPDGVDDSADDSGDDDTQDLPKWLLDRPYLQDRSSWRQDIDMAAPPLVRALGPVGVGNGKVFGLLGNQYPLASWHNLMGPNYQRDFKWFSDKVPSIEIGGVARNPLRESLSYVRRTPIAIASADDGEIEWTSVHFAPRGADDPKTEEALVSVWIVRNISHHDLAGVKLAIEGCLATFRGDRLKESDMMDRHLDLRPLFAAAEAGDEDHQMRVVIGDLAPGEERVVIMPAVFTLLDDDAEAVFTAITDAGVDALLQATVAWWQSWTVQSASLETPDEKINDLFDALVLSIKVNQAASGALTQMSQYSYTWMRDTHGPSILFPLIGLSSDYKTMLDYLYGVSVINGNIGNALPVDADVSSLPPPPDWRSLGLLTGRARTESPSFLVLEYENYYKATGDLATLSDRFDMLWHALAHQQMVDGCLEYFSGDETFEDVMEATFGENILSEPDESTLSSYSSFVMIRAAAFLAKIADLLGRDADATQFGQMSEDFSACLDETFWMPARGFYAVKADTATREPFPRPYEDVNAMPLWLDVLSPDDPKAVENFESILASLGHPNGTLYSQISPIYDWLFPFVNESVQTGMSHAYWLVNLDKMFHPTADEAFRRLSDIVTPAGFAEEALVVDDYTHLSLVREWLGIVCDISARYRSWEGAIIAHALLFHLTGYEYDVTEGSARLAPHLPPEWDHFTWTSLSFGDGRFDLDVRREEAGGRTITIATDGETSFDLLLRVPIDGVFAGATLNGESVAATSDTNAYGRTVVRFPTLDIQADEAAVITVQTGAES